MACSGYGSCDCVVNVSVYSVWFKHQLYPKRPDLLWSISVYCPKRSHAGEREREDMIERKLKEGGKKAGSKAEKSKETREAKRV